MLNTLTVDVAEQENSHVDSKAGVWGGTRVRMLMTRLGVRLLGHILMFAL